MTCLILSCLSSPHTLSYCNSIHSFRYAQTHFSTATTHVAKFLPLATLTQYSPHHYRHHMRRDNRRNRDKLQRVGRELAKNRLKLKINTPTGFATVGNNQSPSLFFHGKFCVLPCIRLPSDKETVHKRK